MRRISPAWALLILLAAAPACSPSSDPGAPAPPAGMERPPVDAAPAEEPAATTPATPAPAPADTATPPAEQPAPKQPPAATTTPTTTRPAPTTKPPAPAPTEPEPQPKPAPATTDDAPPEPAPKPPSPPHAAPSTPATPATPASPTADSSTPIARCAKDPVAVPAGKPGVTRIGVDKCKLCHKVQHASWAESAHAKCSPPLDCEGCHGPGSEYKALTVMKDPAKSREAGLVDPTPAFCREHCHFTGWSDDLLKRAHAHKEG